MNFTEITQNRQSCRSYNPEKQVEKEKLQAILESARLAPLCLQRSAVPYYRLPRGNRFGGCQGLYGHGDE